jgi:hypothetical protein
VPEDLHHHSRWHVLRKQEGRAGVPQVVEANAANACFGDEFVEKRFKLRGSITVPTVEVKTRPESTQAGPSARASAA